MFYNILVINNVKRFFFQMLTTVQFINIDRGILFKLYLVY